MNMIHSNRPGPQGLYDPADERDGCGVGFVAAMDGKPRREVVEAGISALKAVWHRGAVAADGKTGDGAGIMVQIPKAFFANIVARTGHDMADDPLCVGMIFLPRTDYAAQERARAIVETQILGAGFLLYGWRRVPVDVSAVGEHANLVRPEIEQVLFYTPDIEDGEELERALYLVRRRIEAAVLAAHISDFYVCSFSARTLVYKGMFLAEQIDAFFPDLRDPQFVSPFILFHQRYSTNTFPEWRLAQPLHMLAHNGEINTLKGNINWMRSHETQMASAAFGDAGNEIKPVIQPGSSDSAALDSAFEVLVRAGRSVPMVKSLLIPEAWSKRGDTMPENEKAMYAYCNAVMEPWDGPAALVASDGCWVIAGLDRSGLRPLRYALSNNGLLALGSEAGMCPLKEEDIISRGRVHPGRMVGINLDEGRFYSGEPLIAKLASAHDWQSWLDNLTDLDPLICEGPETRRYDDDTLCRKAVAAGFSLEDAHLLLKPAVTEAKEPLGSMGDDTPLAVLSDHYRPLYHFFRQNFSQVTNPPIDPLREGRVMGLITRFKNLGNILDNENTQPGVLTLSSPVLTNGAYDRLVRYLGEEDVTHIDCTFDAHADDEDGESLTEALGRIRNEAVRAVENGFGHLVLSDEAVSESRAAIPMALAVSGVHARLTAEDLRTYCSLIVRAADVLDSHAFAVLIGAGATTVNAYLTQEMIANAQVCGTLGEINYLTAVKSYKTAIENGLLKIMSKMGISVLASYRGGCNFEALGLSRALMAEFFPGVPSRISGIGLTGLERKVCEQRPSTDPPVEGGHRNTGLLGIVKGIDIVANDLPGFVPLAGNQQRVARLQRIHPAQDRFRPVAHLHRAGTPPQHRRPDRCRILAARVVVGDDHHVGMPRRRLPHQHALAGIPVATGADDRHHPPHHMRAQCPQRRGNRVRRVGIVHKHRCPIGPGGHKLHPSAHRHQPRQGGEHPLGIGARGNRQRRRHHHVFRLKSSDQRQSRQIGRPVPRKPHLLPGGIKALGVNAQMHAGLPAHGNHVLAAANGKAGHFLAARVVGVDHRHRVVGQHPLEQPCLGAEIVVEPRVIIQMVLAEVGKRRCRQPHPVQPPLRQAVRGGFHRCMGHASLGHIRQQPVQRNRLRCGVAQRRAEGSFHPGGADIHRLPAQRRPDLPGKGRHRGLAVGAGHRHHRLRLRAKPQRRRIGQRLPRIFGQHHRRCPRRSQRRTGDLRPVAVGQNRARAHAQRIGDKLGPMHPRPRQRGKKMPRLHVAAVHRKAGDSHLRRAERGQTERRQ